MPNNLVFNNVAQNLKTQIFGQFDEQTIPIKTDSMGNLIVSCSKTFTESATAIGDFSLASIVAITEQTGDKEMYTFYIANTSVNTATAWLQISPVNSETFFADDSTGKHLIIPQGQLLLAPRWFLKYTRVVLQNTTALPVSALVFYNAKQ